MTSRAAIGLGSNMGDRAAHQRAGVDALGASDGIVVVEVSRFLETEAIGPEGQRPYLNAAMVVQTTLTPRVLLERCLSIERSRGRDRRRERRWGPRTLDLDLLLFDDLVLDEPGLRVPHPRLAERRFVLEPLAEIAGSWPHPVLGRSVQCLLDTLQVAAKAE